MYFECFFSFLICIIITVVAFEQGYRFSVPFTIVWLVAYIINVDSQIDLRIRNWSRMIIDIIFLSFCLYIFGRQVRYEWKRRAIVLKYIAVVMIIISFDLINFSFELSNKDARCIGEIGYYIWFLIYPFVFFRTVKADSDFWWTDASEPLMESTKQSMKNLELFNLPGYREIHFGMTMFV